MGRFAAGERGPSPGKRRGSGGVRGVRGVVGRFAAGGTGVLHKIDHERGKLCGYIEATSQDISQEVKAWSQIGLPNGQ